ncbi:MAG: 3-deoxy-manno-octulosonate cytidylyltransferase [Sphingobacteriales bacterium]|nr:3-deoxy-manno-octulosonate cytidylyltransferase [Sphingobacteriales bacterium]
MKVLGIIPSRFSSGRLPGKPLLDIMGKTMIQRVYEQAKMSKFLNEVIIATDDHRIVDCVNSFYGNVVITSNEHNSGTLRCAELAKKYTDYDVVINIQGDEPFISPFQIDLLVSAFDDKKIQIATLAKRIFDHKTLSDPNSPKLVLNKESEAIYFSRYPIPYIRDMENQSLSLQEYTFYKHVGTYGYCRDVLLDISNLESSCLEDAEKLEQLCWLENNFKIKVKLTESETLSIDTENDYKKALLFAKEMNL